MREVEGLLRGLVMSRTEVDGSPVRRERPLLQEARAQASLDEAWADIVRMRTARIDLRFVLFVDEHGKVYRVLIQAPRYRPPPAPPPEIEHTRPPPSYLRRNRGVRHLEIERAVLQRRIVHLRSRMIRAQQNAVRSGSTNYDDHTDDPRLEQLEAINIAIELASGGSPATDDKVDARAGHAARRHFEELAEELARELRAREREMEALDRQIRQRREEIDAHRRSGQSGSPGPTGVGAH